MPRQPKAWGLAKAEPSYRGQWAIVISQNMTLAKVGVKSV